MTNNEALRRMGDEAAEMPWKRYADKYRPKQRLGSQLSEHSSPCLRLRQAKTMCSLISSSWKDPSEWEWDISVVSISRKFKPPCTPHVTPSVSGLMNLEGVTGPLPHSVTRQ